MNANKKHNIVQITYHEPLDDTERKIDPTKIMSLDFDMQTAGHVLAALHEHFIDGKNQNPPDVIVYHQYNTHTLMGFLMPPDNQGLYSLYVKSVIPNTFDRLAGHIMQTITIRDVRMNGYVNGKCMYIESKTLIDSLHSVSF